jgi:hypothetical protein
MSKQPTIAQQSATNEVNFEDLEFVKIRIPQNVRFIPESLISSVKGNLYEPEQFYKYQEKQIDNPFNLLYALVEQNEREGKRVAGYLWAEVSQFDNSLFVNTFSVDKKYWFKGKAIPRVIEFLDAIKKKHKCPRVFWITTNDSFFVKHGFKRSKNVLMEYHSG